MKEIRINFHSIVDVITNSSTVIYVGCGDTTITYAKELINTILKIAKSDKTANDLFEFKIAPEKDFATDNLSIEEYTEDIIKLGYTKEDIIAADSDWRKSNEIVNKLYDAIVAGKVKEPTDWDELGNRHDYFDTRQLIIIAKNDDELSMNLSNKLTSIFTINAERDG